MTGERGFGDSFPSFAGTRCGEAMLGGQAQWLVPTQDQRSRAEGLWLPAHS